MFAAMDTDGDGVISKTELRKAIKALKTLDVDNDGSITLAEASAGAAPSNPAGPGGAAVNDPQIAQIMRMDRNNDGKLTANEVPVEMRPMFRGVDQNNDGITREELAAAMATMRNQFGGPGAWPGGAAQGGAANIEQQATGQFLQFDKNGDGKLSEAELPPQGKRLLRDGDTNRDGVLDAGELQAALAKLGGKARALRAGIDPDELGGRKNTARDRNK
jgi:Ca2+-binding EF-hand superfamily protein